MSINNAAQWMDDAAQQKVNAAQGMDDAAQSKVNAAQAKINAAQAMNDASARKVIVPGRRDRGQAERNLPSQNN